MLIDFGFGSKLRCFVCEWSKREWERNGE